MSKIRLTQALLALATTISLSCSVFAADKGFTGMSLDNAHNVQVVAPNSPAQRANIVAGDQVVAVGDVDVRGKPLQEIVDLITGPPGSKVSITILRSGRQYKCDLQRTLSEKTIQSAVSAEWSKQARTGGIYTGLEIDDVNRVTSVDEPSPAFSAGLRPGDRIEQVNGSPMREPDAKSLTEFLMNPSGAGVYLKISRGKNRYDLGLIAGPKPKTQPRKLTLANPSGTPIGGIAPRGAAVAPRSINQPRAGTTQPPASTASAPNSSPPKNLPQTIVDVEIFRRTQYTENTERQVRLALGKVPNRVQEAIKQAGISVLIVPDILSAKPHYNIEKPRGYHDGGGYDNCGGMYTPAEKKIYICERVSYRNSPLRENWYLSSTILHEAGHAYDATANYSKSEAFVKAYEDDGKYLGSEQRKTWEYFLQENDAGRSEMFAELFVANVSPQADADAANLSKAFPRCTKAVLDAIGKN